MGLCKCRTGDIFLRVRFLHSDSLDSWYEISYLRCGKNLGARDQYFYLLHMKVEVAVFDRKASVDGLN